MSLPVVFPLFPRSFFLSFFFFFLFAAVGQVDVPYSAVATGADAEKALKVDVAEQLKAAFAVKLSEGVPSMTSPRHTFKEVPAEEWNVHG